MIKTIRHLLLAFLFVPLLGHGQERDDDMGSAEPDEIVIPVSAVPPRILATAKKAKPSAYIIRVRRQLGDDDETYYAFNVSQVGKYWTISVRADGELMEVSEEGEPPVLSGE